MLLYYLGSTQFLAPLLTSPRFFSRLRQKEERNFQPPPTLILFSLLAFSPATFYPCLPANSALRARESVKVPHVHVRRERSKKQETEGKGRTKIRDGDREREREEINSSIDIYVKTHFVFVNGYNVLCLSFLKLLLAPCILRHRYRVQSFQRDTGCS